MAYGAFIMDVSSRYIVARHHATTTRTDLVMTALEEAIWRRDTLLDGLIAHSHAGQYMSSKYTDRLGAVGG